MSNQGCLGNSCHYSFVKEKSIHESSCCQRFSLSPTTWPHWTRRPWPSTFAELFKACWCPVFWLRFSETSWEDACLLVRARNWACWQRKINFSRKAILTSRTRSPRCSVYPRLSGYSSNGLILSSVYIQFEILLYSLQALRAKTQWSMWLVNLAEPCRPSSSSIISPYFSEDEPSRHICSSLRSWLEGLGVTDTIVFTLYCERGRRSLWSLPCKTIVVFIQAGSFPFSFPSSSQRERDFTNFLH